jgi:2-desacetyl-2-hydroxyethyl bacteriochlorophyllide A dehydrogenase
MGGPINRLSLYFTGPKSVEVREELVPEVKSDHVLIRSLFSAISPGTELLAYRRQIPIDQPLDANIKPLSGNVQYPFKYGYSIVGKVMSAGAEVDPSWIGKTIFTFHPHESFFIACLDELIEIPDGIAPLDAIFLPNMETAVNFVMDGHPVLGEKVIVMGQGIVGLLTTSILAQFPLEKLVTMDFFPLRRRIAQKLGAHIGLDPNLKDDLVKIKSLLKDQYSSGADMTYEISGNPEALNSAIELTGFDGRIIIGSWYGSKPVNLRLGASFHRSRIRLISSQVSTIAPGFNGRWNKSRRFDTVWKMIDKVRPSQLISLQLPLTGASKAYRMLDENPGEVVQIVFTFLDSKDDHV